ncbi:histidine phosphatase family protein [Paucibacter sp. APW11]|uniref:Histidine phosphatase family protein n=1 Tax=Roseateles aquae TaxID=3077235 RepID=A0ABU3PCN1_9BURK|nr:histidine phosphatase family protein [Paucibacter sp. APW11]MDT8999626.1 histidine phosphatase family protein [Paucibacter sp. APW11]
MSLDSATQVLAVRHGETDWNLAGRIQGHSDIGLNERGLWQAQRLADALADEVLAAIYCSDLSRAVQTAQPLAQRLGLPLRCDKGLRERSFGAFEGLHWAEIAAQWPEQSERWHRRDPLFAADGGESLQELHARVLSTAELLAKNHPGQQILLLAHGGVMDTLFRHATHAALDVSRSWELGHARINRLLRSDEGWRVIAWGDGRHLES